jgi:hypothetical protein
VQAPNNVVAIKAITKKNLAKSQNLLGKEIKILKVSRTSWHNFRIRGFSQILGLLF